MNNLEQTFSRVIRELKDHYASDPRKDWVNYMIEQSAHHKRRFFGMIDLLEKERGNILDIGFNAVLTAMYVDLKRFTVELANLGPTLRRDDWTIGGNNLICSHFNVEEHKAPYQDSNFDGILFFEILEHLGIDPMMALQEINRITKLGGFLLLTTPNVISYWSLDKAIKGLHPALSAKYLRRRSNDRHNREYTPNEISDLLRCAGYKIDYLATPSYYTAEKDFEYIKIFLKNMGQTTELRGDTIIARATKINSVVDRYPSFLYY